MFWTGGKPPRLYEYEATTPQSVCIRLMEVLCATCDTNSLPRFLRALNPMEFIAITYFIVFADSKMEVLVHASSILESVNASSAAIFQFTVEHEFVKQSIYYRMQLPITFLLFLGNPHILPSHPFSVGRRGAALSCSLASHPRLPIFWDDGRVESPFSSRKKAGRPVQYETTGYFTQSPPIRGRNGPFRYVVYSLQDKIQ